MRPKTETEDDSDGFVIRFMASLQKGSRRLEKSRSNEDVGTEWKVVVVVVAGVVDVAEVVVSVVGPAAVLMAVSVMVAVTMVVTSDARIRKSVWSH